MPESDLPDWLFPPAGGIITADDLDHMPDLPAHTELIDGGLVFAAPQTAFHSVTGDLLIAGLHRSAPPGFRVRLNMSVVLGPQQRPEPDLCVIRAGAEHSPEQTFYLARDVILVAEIVSPDSQIRDRERKPQLYAQAGIPHFWRVEENQNGRPTVYVYELAPATRAYALSGIHHDRLKLALPFDIDIDLTAIDRL